VILLAILSSVEVIEASLLTSPIPRR